MMSDETRYITFFGGDAGAGEATDAAVLGGKGAGLVAMSRAGLPVPPGFIIAVECCPLFLQDARWPVGLREEVDTALDWLAETRGRTLGEPERPLLVSVRSGAAVSMPGMMDTLLNCGLTPRMASAGSPGFWRVYAQFVMAFAKSVAGETSTLLESLDESACRRVAERCAERVEQQTGVRISDDPRELVRQCLETVWRSWGSARAATYRKQHSIRDIAGTAVTVQAMFASEVSGVVFTTDPTQPDANEMVIEAAYGLGESVVAGDVEPDRFRVDRVSHAIIESRLGRKSHIVRALDDRHPHDPTASCLTESQIKELVALSERAEKLYETPLDLEFGLAEGVFTLLQARPIRGLEIARDVEVGRRAELARLQRLAGRRRKVWVRHNLGETLRMPTPLTWDIVSEFMSGNGGYGRMYRDFGYRPGARFFRDGFLELICGRIYADPDRAAELFWASMPLTYDPEALRNDPKLLESPPTLFDAEKADARFLLRLPRTIWTMTRASRRLAGLRRTALADFKDGALPPYLQYVEDRRGQDLSALDTRAVLAELAARRHRVLTQFGKESLKPGFFGGLAQARLQANLCLLLGAQDGRELATALLTGLEGDTTVAQNRDLCEVARGEMTMAAFLDRYGHRAVGEMELAEPRWREDPSYLEAIVQTYAGTPRDADDCRVDARKEAESSLPALLKAHGGQFLEAEIVRDMRDAQQLLPMREAGKHALMMGYELIRLAILELGRRWGLDGDVFFLHLDELARFEHDRVQLEEQIGARRLRRESARRLEPADVIDSKDWSSFGMPATYEAATELKGEPISGGVFTGPACVVLEPGAAGGFPAGGVLVCPSTDPGWTALFMQAGALVMERGGILSHGAIVARDFGLPAVVCPGATKRIEDGQNVRVDGNRGVVCVEE